MLFCNDMWTYLLHSKGCGWKTTPQKRMWCFPKDQQNEETSEGCIRFVLLKNRFTTPALFPSHLEFCEARNVVVSDSMLWDLENLKCVLIDAPICICYSTSYYTNMISDSHFDHGMESMIWQNTKNVKRWKSLTSKKPLCWNADFFLINAMRFWWILWNTK